MPIQRDATPVASTLSPPQRELRARGTLGEELPLDYFRLFSDSLVTDLHTLEDDAVIEDHLFTAGKRAGDVFSRVVSKNTIHLPKKLAVLSEALYDFKVGIASFRIQPGYIRFTITECVHCAGAKPSGRALCRFEAGIVAGALESFVEREIDGASVTETKCWGLGDDRCEFTVAMPV